MDALRAIAAVYTFVVALVKPWPCQFDMYDESGASTTSTDAQPFLFEDIVYYRPFIPLKIYHPYHNRPCIFCRLAQSLKIIPYKPAKAAA